MFINRKKAFYENKKFFLFSFLFFVLVNLGMTQSIPSLSLPNGADIVAGKVQVESLGNKMQINQFSSKAAIDGMNLTWKDASVEFFQPNPASSILNQVSSEDPSFILGKVSSNGNVFITNGNGIFFEKCYRGCGWVSCKYNGNQNRRFY